MAKTRASDLIVYPPPIALKAVAVFVSDGEVSELPLAVFGCQAVRHGCRDFAHQVLVWDPEFQQPASVAEYERYQTRHGDEPELDCAVIVGPALDPEGFAAEVERAKVRLLGDVRRRPR